MGSIVLETQTTLMVIAAATTLLAVLVSIFALRASAGARSAAAPWKERVRGLDQKSAQTEAVLGAYPGLILVWEDEKPDPAAQHWGEPKTYGSSAALASLVRFAAPGKPKDFAIRIMSGLADYTTVIRGGSRNNEDEKTLGELMENLCNKAQVFSASISLPEGKIIEIDGDVAGRQIVLWLADSSLRGQDEKTAITSVENETMAALSDPVALVDLVSKTPFPIWRMNSKGDIVWANLAYMDAVSAPSMQAVLDGQALLDDLCAAQVTQVLTQGEAVRETRPLVVNGARKPSAISMFPISGGVAGMAIDVSDAEHLREVLTRHIRAHDETLNNMGEAVVIFGPDQRMNFHNTAFAKMFGLDADWFVDRPSHGEWLDHLRQSRKLQEHTPFGDWKMAELSYYTDWPDEVPDELWSLPDGRELRLVRMRDANGGLSLLFGDITDQMSMQSKFDTLINVQEATLDKLSEGVAVFGLDGRLKISNSAYKDMWNLPDALMHNEPLFKELIKAHLTLYHDRDFWQEMMARTTDTSPEVRRHISGEIHRSDDSVLSYLSKPLPDGATLIAWDDITNSRRTEAALIERAEAVEAADRLKSEFVGHVSYQLRTPLTTISGFAEFLQSGGAGELSDKQSEYVFAIETAAKDLTKSIDDILDITAIEADVVDMELGDVDLHALLEGALDYVATNAEDTKIALHLNCSKDIGIIRADEKRIKQVVYNLLSNALRFTKPGGKIELGGDAVDTGVRIWVKDNGVGIPSEQQPQVFESFKSSRGGAGLGLALVERFVARHGGWVELESEEGKGTHVICYLPRLASLEGAAPELDL